jgi:hypothetical protein
MNVSNNPNITWEIIQANPEIHWCWPLVSENPNITWDIVEAHPEIPWSYRHFSWNEMNKHPVLAKRIEEKESKERIVARNRQIKEEMMAYYWHPDRYTFWAFDDE